MTENYGYEIDMLPVGSGEKSGDAIALRYGNDADGYKVMVVDGGPGYATTASRDFFLSTLGDVRRWFDIVLLDSRGTGSSQRLDCRALHDPHLPAAQAAARCARALGPRLGWFTTVNAARDMDAVRQSLHARKVAVFGVSYGTFLAQTYAASYPGHTDRLVLDGAFPTTGLDPYARETVPAVARAIRVGCRENPDCRADPVGRLARAAALLRARPSTLRAPDGAGRPQQVHLNERSLADLVSQIDEQPRLLGELDAAMRALLSGDRLPLGCLQAESLTAGDDVSEATFSDADYLAIACHDYPQVWGAQPPGPRRDKLLADGIAALPASTFFPFSLHGWTAGSGYGPRECLGWPHLSGALPPAPAGVTAPVLVLGGEVDVRTPREHALKVSAHFPNATYVQVRDAGHVTTAQDESGCTARVLRRFLQRRIARPGCTPTAPSPLAVATFWTTTGKAPAATPVGPLLGVRLEERRRATAAAATLRDTLARVSAFGQSHGRGLRGGTFAVITRAHRSTIRLSGVRLVRDLAVSGTATWHSKGATVRATVTVSGSDRRHTRMSLRFRAAADRPPPRVRVGDHTLLAPRGLGLTDLPTP